MQQWCYVIQSIIVSCIIPTTVLNSGDGENNPIVCCHFFFFFFARTIGHCVTKYTALQSEMISGVHSQNALCTKSDDDKWVTEFHRRTDRKLSPFGLR